MATLSMLRENLRGDLSDIVRLASERRFENEYLERALFSALQQHNRNYTWGSLPPAEEQLVLILSKAKIAWDFSVNYALDPKMNVGQAVRDKSSNAQILQSIAKDLRAEYQAELALVTADPDEGEVTIGTLTRTDYGTRAQFPSQAATRPQPMVISFAEYLYDPILGGKVKWKWERFPEVDLAYIQVVVSRKCPVTIQDTVIRTLYDVWVDPLAIPPVPPFAQEEGYVSYTLLPTGRWYLAMIAWNWNRLSNWSNSIPLDVKNYIEIPADTFVMVGA